jgi:glycosyltransferase involved in cell wall biosynthesis
MTRPRLSVCLVTCNQRDFIGKCLLSVLEQEVDAELRILVGDDASDDGTSEIVAALASEHSDKVLHLRREPRLGAMANMRDLMTRADGDFVARVDGDDYWLPGKLAKQLACLQAHPECSAVYANAITVDEAGRELGLFNDIGDSRLSLASLLRRGNALNNSSVLFRSTNTAAWSGGDQIDYQVHLWHARHGWLGHIGEPLAAYRVNTQGSLVLSANERVRELYWQAIQSVPRELVSDDDYAHGLADFLRRVLFRAVSTRDLALLRRWAGPVFDAAPCSRLRIGLMVFVKASRMAGKMLWARFVGVTGPTRPHILHPG